MRRYHLFEFHDQPWFPAFLRDAETDYLRQAIRVGKAYDPIAPKLAQAIKQGQAQRIVDLCAGGGGPWIGLLAPLRQGGFEGEVLLTDRYPNRVAFQAIEAASDGQVRAMLEPVDASCVPAECAGFRTLFSSFHHFTPPQAHAILRDAVERRQGVGVFEGTARTPMHLLLMLLIVPWMALLLTPTIRPFRLSRLLFTYLIPVLPLVISFDGFVSCLRTYTEAELREMTADLTAFDWDIGAAKPPKGPGGVLYCIGTPK